MPEPKALLGLLEKWRGAGSTEERAEIFRIHLAKRNRNPEEFDLPALAAANT